LIEVLGTFLEILNLCPKLSLLLLLFRIAPFGGLFLELLFLIAKIFFVLGEEFLSDRDVLLEPVEPACLPWTFPAPIAGPRRPS